MSAVRDCHRPPFSFWEVFMRRVTAVFTTSLFLSLSAWAGAVAAPMVQSVTDQPPMDQAVTVQAPTDQTVMGQAVEGVTPEALCIASPLRLSSTLGRRARRAESCHRSFRRLRSGRMEPSFQQGRLLPGAVPLHQGARGSSARAALRARGGHGERRGQEARRRKAAPERADRQGQRLGHACPRLYLCLLYTS